MTGPPVRLGEPLNGGVTAAYFPVYAGPRRVGEVGYYTADREVWLHWHINEDRRRRGYGYQAVRLLVDLLRDRRRLVAAIRPENTASLMLARKLGFTLAGDDPDLAMQPGPNAGNVVLELTPRAGAGNTEGGTSAGLPPRRHTSGLT